MIEPISKSTIAAHGTIAIFGAVVHALKAHRDGKSKAWSDFPILLIMASFSGVMFGLIGINYLPQETYLTMVMAGSGGFLGVEGMSLIVARVTSIINPPK